MLLFFFFYILTAQYRKTKKKYKHTHTHTHTQKHINTTNRWQQRWVDGIEFEFKIFIKNAKKKNENTHRNTHNLKRKVREKREKIELGRGSDAPDDPHNETKNEKKM